MKMLKQIIKASVMIAGERFIEKVNQMFSHEQIVDFKNKVNKREFYRQFLERVGKIDSNEKLAKFE